MFKTNCYITMTVGHILKVPCCILKVPCYILRFLVMYLRFRVVFTVAYRTLKTVELMFKNLAFRWRGW